MKRVPDILSKSVTSVVFCGGKATRLTPLGLGVPKALVPIGSDNYLRGLLRLLRSFNLDQIVLCVSPSTMRIASDLGDGRSLGVNIRYAVDTGDVENAGALRNAWPDLHTPLLLCINGDVLFDVDIDKLIASHVWSGATATLVASSRLDQPHAGGIEVGISGWVRDIHEADQDQGKVIVASPTSVLRSNSGVYVLDRRKVDQNWPARYHIGKVEEGLLRWLAKENRLWAFDNGYRYLLDLGTPDRLRRAFSTIWQVVPFFPL